MILDILKTENTNMNNFRALNYIVLRRERYFSQALPLGLKKTKYEQ